MNSYLDLQQWGFVAGRQRARTWVFRSWWSGRPSPRSPCAWSSRPCRSRCAGSTCPSFAARSRSWLLFELVQINKKCKLKLSLILWAGFGSSVDWLLQCVRNWFPKRLVLSRASPFIRVMTSQVFITHWGCNYNIPAPLAPNGYHPATEASNSTVLDVEKTSFCSNVHRNTASCIVSPIHFIHLLFAMLCLPAGRPARLNCRANVSGKNNSCSGQPSVEGVRIKPAGVGVRT